MILPAMLHKTHEEDTAQNLQKVFHGVIFSQYDHWDFETSNHQEMDDMPITFLL